MGRHFRLKAMPPNVLGAGVRETSRRLPRQAETAHLAVTNERADGRLGPRSSSVDGVESPVT